MWISVLMLLAASSGGSAEIARAKSPQQAQIRYQYVDLGVLSGGTTSAAWNINNAGQVVGASSTAIPGAGHAFLWQNGQLTDLGTISGGTFSASAAYGINESGHIVGQTNVNASDPPHAFLWKSGVMQYLGTGFGPGSFSQGLEYQRHRLDCG